METKTLSIKGIHPIELLGSQDEYLQLIEKAFHSTVVVRGDQVIIKGEPDEAETLYKLFTELIFLLNRNGTLEAKDITTVIDLTKAGRLKMDENNGKSPIVVYGKNGIIRPKSKGQTAYFESGLQNDIVIAIGPAGTGKTYLAVAMALARLREKEVARIVLTRPAIEAGESLGFLPGDLMEKVDPYLRPLTDALFDMLPGDQLQKYVDRKIIEIVPLAYMRGRTLNNAFVILDEAQNTSPMQMKMFLTRLGNSSRAIITGDVTQIDLSENVESGLIQIQSILKDIEGIGFVTLDKSDVVRHRLVKEIIQAYELFHQNKNDEEKKP